MKSFIRCFRSWRWFIKFGQPYDLYHSNFWGNLSDPDYLKEIEDITNFYGLY